MWFTIKKTTNEINAFVNKVISIKSNSDLINDFTKIGNKFKDYTV